MEYKLILRRATHGNPKVIPINRVIAECYPVILCIIASFMANSKASTPGTSWTHSAGALEDASGLLDGERGSVAAAWAALLRVLSAVCAPGWERLPAEERARVLAPAYMALCRLVLYGETRRAYHAEAAETLALIAFARLGL